MPNPFTEKYKTLSNTQLLDIIEHSSHYTNEALEAARNEISSRQLSEESIQEAKENLKYKTEFSQKSPSPILNGVQQVSRFSMQRLFPDNLLAIEKILRSICITLMLLMFFSLIKRIALFKLELFSDAGTIFFLFYEPVITTTVVFLLWRKHILGWVILSLYLFSFIQNDIIKWVMFLIRESNTNTDTSLIPSQVFYTCVTMAIYLFLTYILNTRRMRALFRVKRIVQYACFATGLMLNVAPLTIF